MTIHIVAHVHKCVVVVLARHEDTNCFDTPKTHCQPTPCSNTLTFLGLADPNPFFDAACTTSRGVLRGLCCSSKLLRNALLPLLLRCSILLLF